MLTPRYSPGFSYHMRFGGPYGSNEHGVCLYGDVGHPAAQYACDAAGYIEHPDQAALSDHQKISFWFRFADIRPYGKVIEAFDAVMAKLETVGFTAAKSIEGLPDTGSTVDDLVDTDAPPYWGKSEEGFPREPNAHGYNAAKGFCVVVERIGTKVEFSPDEIETIRDLAKECGNLVFGHALEEEVAAHA